ncbi:MAG: metallophosphoesterase family protein [Planctomycetota bacterium]|jgi:3',5'-cyclic AMP phosphodiesterase CpdA
MKKIIHFSDIHIGHKDMSSRFNDVICNLVKIKQPAKNYVIVITGDIVESASMENYRIATEYLDLLTVQGYQLLIVPGNHDYISGKLAEKKWVSQFKKQFLNNYTSTYPKLDIIDDCAFIGLDSMEGELGFFDRIGANGEVGEKQLINLDKKLASKKVQDCDKIVIYLHHHPFDPIPLHELKDSEQLSKILAKYNTGRFKIDAVLFGHLHHGRKWNGWCNIPRVYDAGTTTMKDECPGFHRVIDLKREPLYDYDADFHGNYAIEQKLSMHKALLDFLVNR